MPLLALGGTGDGRPDHAPVAGPMPKRAGPGQPQAPRARPSCWPLLKCQCHSVRKWKTSPRCRSVAVAAQLAPSVAAAPLARACRCPSQAPPGNRNLNPGGPGFLQAHACNSHASGPVLLAAAVKNVRHATAPTLRATEPAPSPGVRADLATRGVEAVPNFKLKCLTSSHSRLVVIPDAIRLAEVNGAVTCGRPRVVDIVKRTVATSASDLTGRMRR